MLGLGLSMSPNLSKDCDCILCSQPAQFVPGTDPIPFDCPRCGRFKITFDCMANLGSCEKQWPALSAATRESSERGKWLTISLGNYEALADEHRWTSGQQKSLKILEWIRTRSSSFKHEVPLDPATDYPLFDAFSQGECEALMQHLSENSFISHADDIASMGWYLTMEGWEAVEPLSPSGIPGRCFVAMAFDKELDDAYYEAIKPAVIEAGYEPICMKERLTNDNICDVILAEIRRAQFIVADFTKQKGGVYFEAGFAKALGKEGFWTCRQDDFAALHFDTNHYGHLKWSDPADLKGQLGARIVAELGVGPSAKSRP